MQRFRSFVWLLPYLAVTIADSVAKPIERWQGVALAALASCLLGWAAGVVWFSVYPRPLAERLNGLAALWAFFIFLVGVTAIVHLFGGSFGTVTVEGGGGYGAAAAVSILAGLVLAEINDGPRYHSRWRRWTTRPKAVPIDSNQPGMRHSDLSADS